ncbi:DUF3899 domain-containing protein [Jeotgalibacillus proteolyticus]|uniref:DUF3899 domain-containing protein n=1 Tax=Jeotgalibacillus proteolyticus TaxID=2082395 RepID=UPI003CF4BD50
MKWKIALFIAMIVIWQSLMIVVPLSPIEWVNLSFLVGLVFLLVSASVMIHRSRFLDPVFKGFKLVGEKMVHKSRSMQRADQLVSEDRKFQEFKDVTTRSIGDSTLIIGGSSVLVSIFVLFI